MNVCVRVFEVSVFSCCRCQIKALSDLLSDKQTGDELSPPVTSLPSLNRYEPLRRRLALPVLLCWRKYSDFLLGMKNCSNVSLKHMVQV